MEETYILFEVAGATYAVRSGQVHMVEMVEYITRVPRAPDFVEGVAAVRGRIIPVVSIRRRFHMPAEEPTLRTRLIVINLDGRLIGMLVDSAREFIRVEMDQIQPPPADLVKPGVEYVNGVIQLNNRPVLIVNLPRLFNRDESEELSQPFEEDQPA